MSHDIFVTLTLSIPAQELEFLASRSGGPGGQHVNKTETRVTLQWNVQQSRALTSEQRARVLEKLQSRITVDGYLVVHSSTSRSREQNKKDACERLGQLVRRALQVPKKRMKTRPSKTTVEQRLRSKAQRSKLKQLRSSKQHDE